MNHKSSPCHKSSLWSGAIAILILSFFIAYRFLGDALYYYPSNPELKNLSPQAVIICLAGGKGRIEAAYDLYAQGFGSELVIIGAGPKVTAATLEKSLPKFIREKLDTKKLSNIFVENESKNTIENAYAISHWLKKNSHRKELILITSSYHMRRSLMMLKSSLPTDIQVIPYTPPKEIISREEWFKTWIGIEVTGYEYLKYIFAKLLLPHLKSF